MTDHSPVQSNSEKLKKAIVWVSETMQAYPERKRARVLEDALLRYDLTPLDCEFLHRHFSVEGRTK